MWRWRSSSCSTCSRRTQRMHATGNCLLHFHVSGAVCAKPQARREVFAFPDDVALGTILVILPICILPEILPMRCQFAMFFLILFGGIAAAQEPTLNKYTAPTDNKSDEPMAKSFSLEKAVSFLDNAALQWTDKRD